MSQEFNDHPDNISTLKSRLLCIVTQSEIGGAQRFLIQLLTRINRARFDVSIAVGGDGDGELRECLPQNIQFTIISSLKRNISPINDFKAFVEIRRLILCDKPEIVLFLSSKAGFIGSLAAYFVRPRPAIIYRIGGWSFNDPIPHIMRWLYILLEFVSAKLKDYIVVNSSKDADDAKRLGIKPRKELLIIYNGIDPYLPFFDRKVARLEITNRMNYGQEFDDIFLVGTIANFYPAKGLEYLIRAAEQCPRNIMFVVIGDGPLRSRLEQLIAKFRLEERLYLIGKFRNAAYYLPAFDAFVLPSLKEGFPWVILEAMAAKVPIIATRVGAIPEIIEHEKSGFIVESCDADNLTNAITRLTDDNEHLRREMPIRAHQKLLAQFDVRKMVEKFERLFDTAIYRSPR